MPVQIVRNDITKMSCDAIVNATDERLSGGGGGDRAIHEAAGEELAAACRTLGGISEGEAKLTPGFKLPCRYVIHTVGPEWQGGDCGEREILRSCYLNSLELAKSALCQSVAFPLISAGTFGYPRDKAMSTALEAVSEFLMSNDMLVYIVLYNGEAYRMGQKLFADIQSYIDDNYVAERASVCAAPCSSVQNENRRPGIAKASRPKASRRPHEEENDFLECMFKADAVGAAFGADLDDELEQYLKKSRDESFSQMLLRCIDERGMKDSECYKRANIDRKLFSKIRSDANYRPSKTTVQAFAVALRMDIHETEELMQKAGYAFTNTSKGDVIVRFFIERGIYDVMTINEALFSFDQKLLGS